MNTVPQPQIKAKYATVYDEAVTILKVPAGLYVLYEDSHLEPFTVEMAPFTVVLGDVDVADTQQLLDQVAGGYAAIATHRAMEVA